MKVAIVVGHHPMSRGAQATDGAHEYDMNLVLAHQIVSTMCPTIEARKFVHTAGGRASQVLGQTVDELNDWGADVVVELHWNAAVDANGNRATFFWTASHSVIFKGSDKARELGFLLSTACAGALGTDDMGVRVRESGYPMLRDTTGAAVILETHNGLDEESHDAFVAALADGSLAFNIRRAVMAYCEGSDGPRGASIQA